MPSGRSERYRTLAQCLLRRVIPAPTSTGAVIGSAVMVSTVAGDIPRGVDAGLAFTTRAAHAPSRLPFRTGAIDTPHQAPIEPLAIRACAAVTDHRILENRPSGAPS
jgi:hypothetical protein